GPSAEPVAIKISDRRGFRPIPSAPKSATKTPAMAHEKLLDEYHHAVSRFNGDCATIATATNAAIREPVSRTSQRPSRLRTNPHAVTDARQNPIGASRRS